VIMLGHRRSRRPPYASSDPRIRYVQGNIENLSALEAAFKGADCIFHIGTPAPVTKSCTRRENRPARYPALSNVRHLCSAALVGPFYKKEMYWRVNLNGTKNVIAACKSQNVRKVVCAGTPSTRMDGRDIDGKTEDELPMPKRFTAHYAETKALAELALREAAEEGHLLTVTVCPHQVALLAPRHTSTPCINAAGTAPTPPCFPDLCYRLRAISTCGT
jgi:sterol-4alpha-carboxylate 3-dehydrogenase (decarboxylating)